MQQALFGGGCFWCVEAVFLQLKGVEKVVSGYAGGHTEHPSYDDICRGDTNHAEVILIDYDETQISFAQLLDVFFTTHDPTTLNRQGNDIGTQYRSVIYYFNDEQQQQAQPCADPAPCPELPHKTEYRRGRARRLNRGAVLRDGADGR